MGTKNTKVILDKKITDEQRKFLFDFQNSPMGQQMLYNSVKQDDPLGPDYIHFKNLLNARNRALKDVSVNYYDFNDLKYRNSYYKAFGKKDNEISYTGGWYEPHGSNYKKNVYRDAMFGNNEGSTIYVHNRNPFKTIQGIVRHEGSHAQDRSGYLMPNSDKNKIKQYAFKGYDAKTLIPKSLTDWQRYVSKPSETRARLSDFRKSAKEQGLYDPFTQKATMDVLNNYKQDDTGFDPYDQLLDVFSKDEILDMLNTISKNNSAPQQNGMLYALNGTTGGNPIDNIFNEPSIGIDISGLTQPNNSLYAYGNPNLPFGEGIAGFSSNPMQGQGYALSGIQGLGNVGKAGKAASDAADVGADQSEKEDKVPWNELIRQGIDVTTGIANMVNSSKANEKEKMAYRESLQPGQYDNPQRFGTNDNQMYFKNGGYTVKPSHDRKGKTHVVIGPDGTKKYFGDSKLGQHPNDPERKKAFYARHEHNLKKNPYFRAFARATWQNGGNVPIYKNGTPGLYPLNLDVNTRAGFTPASTAVNKFMPLSDDQLLRNRLNSQPVRPQAVISPRGKTPTPYEQAMSRQAFARDAKRNTALAQTMASFTPGNNIDAGVIGAESFVNTNPLISGPVMSMSRIAPFLAHPAYNHYFNPDQTMGDKALGALGLAGDLAMIYPFFKAGVSPNSNVKLGSLYNLQRNVPLRNNNLSVSVPKTNTPKVSTTLLNDLKRNSPEQGGSMQYPNSITFKDPLTGELVYEYEKADFNDFKTWKDFEEAQIFMSKSKKEWYKNQRAQTDEALNTARRIGMYGNKPYPMVTMKDIYGPNLLENRQFPGFDIPDYFDFLGNEYARFRRSNSGQVYDMFPSEKWVPYKAVQALQHVNPNKNGGIPKYKNGKPSFYPLDLSMSTRVSSDNTRQFKPDAQTHAVAEQKYNDIKHQQELQQYQDKLQQATIKPSGSSQGVISKTKEVLVNPMTALGYVMQKQRIPDYFSKGSRNILDYATDVVNPFSYIDAAQGVVKGTTSGLYNTATGNFSEALGDFGGAGLDILSMIPLASEIKPVKGILKNSMRVGLRPFMQQLSYTGNKMKPGYNPFIYKHFNRAEVYPKDHILGIVKGYNDIFYRNRPFFDAFPITRAQRNKVIQAQDDEMNQALQFGKDWFYDENGNFRKSILDKLKRINPNFDDLPYTVGYHSKLLKDNPLNSLPNAIEFLDKKSLKAIGLDDKQIDYIRKKRGSIAGFNQGDKNTLIRRTGLYYEDPSTFGETVAHEVAGHGGQHLTGLYDDLSVFNDELTSYRIPNLNTDIGRLMGKHMTPYKSWEAELQPFYDEINKLDESINNHILTASKNKTNVDKRFIYDNNSKIGDINTKIKNFKRDKELDYFTWNASPLEPYAELMSGRYQAFKSYKKQYPHLSDNQIIEHLQNTSNDNNKLLNNILNASGWADRSFFKPKTSDAVKRYIAKVLPAVTGLGLLNTTQTEKRNGGDMIRRVDGSYSQRGLWDNIRANAGSGKKPTKQMLEQERKIQSKHRNGGYIPKFDVGGSTFEENPDEKLKASNANDFLITPEEYYLYTKRLQDCKEGRGCLEQAFNYYDNYVAPNLKLPSSWQIKENAGISSGDNNPRFKEYGKSADSWDIHALLQDKGAKKVLAASLNNPADIETMLRKMSPDQQAQYFRNLKIPIGSIIGMGDRGGTGGIYGTTVYNSTKGLPNSNHSGMVIGYDETGLPMLYDYGHIVPITNRTFGVLPITNITSPKEVSQYTYDYLKANNLLENNYYPLDIQTNTKGYDEDEYTPFIDALTTNKKKFGSAFNLKDSEYDELARRAAAIALTESGGGDDLSIRWKGPGNLIPVPSYVTDKMGIGETTGITQINSDMLFSNNSISRKLKMLDITKHNFDPWDPKHIAAATMALLQSNQGPQKANYAKNVAKLGYDPKLSDPAITYYQWNQPRLLRSGQALGDSERVKNFINNYNKVYIKPHKQNGGIMIKPENRGKFTAFANSRDMGVQEAAQFVLNNREQFSPMRVKQANFAHNAAGWNKQNGGLNNNNMMFKRGGANKQPILLGDLDNLTEEEMMNGPVNGFIGDVIPEQMDYLPMQPMVLDPVTKLPIHPMYLQPQYLPMPERQQVMLTDLNTAPPASEALLEGVTDNVYTRNNPFRSKPTETQRLKNSLLPNTYYTRPNDILHTNEKYKLDEKDVKAVKKLMYDFERTTDPIKKKRIAFQIAQYKLFDQYTNQYQHIDPYNLSRSFPFVPKKANGGAVDQIQGLPPGHPAANAIVESGEAVDFGNGQMAMVADQGPYIEDHGDTHDGTYLPNVQRVLEDTSAKVGRNKKSDKLLAMNGSELNELFGGMGLNFKGKYSHASAFEKVSDAVEGERKKYMDKNQRLSKLSNLSEAQRRAMELNETFAAMLPQKQDIFEMLFQHQEGVKQQNGISDSGKQDNLPKGKYGLSLYGGGGPSFGSSYNKQLETPKPFNLNDPSTYGIQSGLNLGKGFSAGMGMANMSGTYDAASTFGNSIDLRNTSPNNNASTTPLNQSSNSNFSPEDFVATINDALANRTPHKEPLQWYDQLGPTSSLINSMSRYPESSFDVNLPRMQNPFKVNPQTQLNEVTASLRPAMRDSLNPVVRAQLMANADQARSGILANTENVNNQLMNTWAQGNNAIGVQESLMRTQMGQDFANRVLQSKTKQDEQRLQSLSDIGKMYGQNRQFNKMLNLLDTPNMTYDPQTQRIEFNRNSPASLLAAGLPAMGVWGEGRSKATPSKMSAAQMKWMMENFPAVFQQQTMAGMPT